MIHHIDAMSIQAIALSCLGLYVALHILLLVLIYRDLHARTGCVDAKPIFALYDCWIGAYWNSEKQTWYWFPVPCFGLKLRAVITDDESRLSAS